MTLDEMLALLADNTTGAIGADDLRAIVTDLYHAANASVESIPYDWTNNATPGNGAVTVIGGWSLSASAVLMSETDKAAVTHSFFVFDNAATRRMVLTSGTNRLEADATGPSVDQGVYRQIPVAVRSVVGTIPANNANVTATLVAVQA